MFSRQYLFSVTYPVLLLVYWKLALKYLLSFFSHRSNCSDAALIISKAMVPVSTNTKLFFKKNKKNKYSIILPVTHKLFWV